MRISFIALLLAFFANSVFSNKIDNLKTDKDVADFIISLSPNIQKGQDRVKFIIKPTDVLRKELACDGIAEKWQINNWEKFDFNEDGLTDIIVTSHWYNYDVYVAMDNGDNTFKLFKLSHDVFEKCKLGKPATINNHPALLFYQVKQEPDRTRVFNYKQYGQIDTLIYKYGAFIEKNEKPARYAIDSIIVKNSSCLGSCPSFTLAINKDRDALYHANFYNPVDGKFTAKIDKADYIGIIALINYISIKNLKDHYAVPWTDDQTATLRIRFRDGSVKEITDYGEVGTFGLNKLYKMLSALRTSQNWAKSGKIL
ncbi:hypothetical protein BEL04_18775 [Mucilaginibacter sp. PPCGB 2223]|uniref:DUF6438 domain-containing protein n=1 Tax=Mucilaginibacter sp. PPCGB 2223 TaxID=1886027 RepID=UPI000826090B|nr:DUF6438 domain-containing protein [Mucilaginibacter sp. PPCGB 2223]OCX50779.1 hypothetical protein BEL04_18775 [Mucilaginibacter sp. PPCGB 2223]